MIFYDDGSETLVVMYLCRQCKETYLVVSNYQGKTYSHTLDCGECRYEAEGL